jgi:hypothetical protein
VKPGDAVDFKRRPGLGSWSKGTLVSADGRHCTVRDRSGEYEVAASRVRSGTTKVAQKARRTLTHQVATAVNEAVAVPRAAPPSRSLFFPQPKAARIVSEKYLAYVRRHPCCACGRPGPSDPHHVQLKGHGSMGSKTHDIRTVPLCREHHDEVGRDPLGCIARVAARDPHVPPRRATSIFFETTMVALFVEWWQRGGPVDVEAA